MLKLVVFVPSAPIGDARSKRTHEWLNVSRTRVCRSKHQNQQPHPRCATEPFAMLAGKRQRPNVRVALVSLRLVSSRAHDDDITVCVRTVIIHPVNRPICVRSGPMCQRFERHRAGGVVDELDELRRNLLLDNPPARICVPTQLEPLRVIPVWPSGIGEVSASSLVSFDYVEGGIDGRYLAIHRHSPPDTPANFRCVILLHPFHASSF